ncbi:peptidoglycan L-alanyl-D-glutamate endopeptidase CwlK [Aquimarina intermedia]|uniref:Peptidoglycan L-alanyl-D-glutamate endopeptidase CwlK n=2 Tax=Aquimarina intermedia TaxID=350814 RepID=A0A5S5BZ35_9FLAO|nr:peptidoglycan L-alanyl-D-glutamate endopeptidase CwlK [Aquimarina intermedia]
MRITYKFGDRSRKNLETCHEDLQKVLNLAISRSKVDFGISEGHRPVERQYRLYLKGASKIDGYKRKGKHNYFPSLAADIYIYHPDKTMRGKIDYDEVHLSYVSGVIDACAVELYECGKIKHLIRWGGNWDSDGIIKFDQSFQDMPHHEIIEP